MNDQHVHALHYRLIRPSGSDYDNASPLDYENDDFRMHVENYAAVVEMKTHLPDTIDARKLVEPFLDAWELDAGLKLNPGAIKFQYDHTEMRDRGPTTGAGQTHIVLEAPLGTLSIKTRTSLPKYPDPPEGLQVSDEARRMYVRYVWYLEGRTLLLDLVNFCETVLKESAGSRSKAATKFRIANPVLNTMGRLAGEKGGEMARKARGIGNPLTTSEANWLVMVVPMIIRRAAEIAGNPDGEHPLITMADLPPLEIDLLYGAEQPPHSF